MTTKVSGNYAGQKIKQLFLNVKKTKLSRTKTHIRNANRIVKTLGELKGAVMKVGQAISIHTDLLPREFARILSSLQQTAPR